jgi:histidinol dehydrogenase
VPIIRQLDLRGLTPTELELASLLPRAVLDITAAMDVAESVVANVRSGGVSYIRELTKKLDNFDPEPLRVSNLELSNALEALAPELRSAIATSIERNRKVSEAAMPSPLTMDLSNGANVSQRYVPMDSVGLYVPGGKAVYPSSVVMNVVPAQVAGVESIFLASPGQKEFGGRPHPTVLATAEMLGVRNVLCIGGPAAIASFAYGLPEIDLPQVRLITGPGNAYVAAAKKIARQVVAIDSEAGTTEILIIADRNANPKFVAADLISQAEHDESAAAVLLTDSAQLIEDVTIELARQVKSQKHSTRIEEALSGQQSALVLVDSIDQALVISNSYATEHLQIMVSEPSSLLPKIRNAGAVFLGNYSPVSLGDYLAGSNHVLPTGGAAKFSSGLGVHTFLRPQQVIDYSAAALSELSESLPVFASAEDLPAHGEAVNKRFES